MSNRHAEFEISRTFFVNLNNFYKQSRNLFTASAKKAGKGNAAKKLDKDYSLKINSVNI